MRTILFTGATGGLGGLSVRELAKRGWKVFAAGTNEARLKALDEVENVVPIKMDVTRIADIKAGYALVKQHTDRLDAIANFAGLTAFASFVEGDPVTLTEQLLDINMMGMVRVNRVFFDLVEKGRGRIINCSSSAGWMTAQPFNGPYVLSKYAVEGYNDSLRRELMLLNIPVIKIQPGSFKTPITDAAVDGYDRTYKQTEHYKIELKKMKPMMDMVFRHSGDPVRVARVVIRALEARHPRRCYRVGSNFLLLLMELIPEWGIDGLYKLLFKQKTERKDGHGKS